MKRRLTIDRFLIEKLGVSLISLVTALTVIPIIGVFGYIIAKGTPAISWEFLTAMPRAGMRAGGILPAIIGTFYLTLGTAIFSVPLGIAAAIYLAEYARENWVTRLIRISIINLAGIPSVVYGLFGLGLFVLFLKFGTSLLAASLTLSIMTLPVVISAAEEALRAVPQSFRTVSLSLGGKPFERLSCRRRSPASSPASSWDWSGLLARPPRYFLPVQPSSCRAFPIRRWMPPWPCHTIYLLFPPRYQRCPSRSNMEQRSF
jgi:phosphate transport system permease protein